MGGKAGFRLCPMGKFARNGERVKSGVAVHRSVAETLDAFVSEGHSKTALAILRTFQKIINPDPCEGRGEAPFLNCAAEVIHSRGRTNYKEELYLYY